MWTFLIHAFYKHTSSTREVTLLTRRKEPASACGDCAQKWSSQIVSDFLEEFEKHMGRREGRGKTTRSKLDESPAEGM